MDYHGITLPRAALAEFCRRHHISRLALFGSILGPDFGPESDIDLLVEFEPGHGASLFAMARMERELTELLGRQVDLRTPAELSRYFRDEVVRQSVPQYP
ncbi:MAG: nucleotidyltransferase family protein [Pseudomonadota bacterium]